MPKARKKFQAAKETSGSASLDEHRDNAMWGPLRHTTAHRCVHALLIARRDGRPYPNHWLQELADAVCDGRKDFLEEIGKVVDFFGAATIHDRRWRLADPLRYFLVEFAQAWRSYWSHPISTTAREDLSGEFPSLKDIQRYLAINRVPKIDAATLRRIWKREMGQQLAGAGRPKTNKAKELARRGFFIAQEDKRAAEIANVAARMKK